MMKVDSPTKSPDDIGILPGSWDDTPDGIMPYAGDHQPCCGGRPETAPENREPNGPPQLPIISFVPRIQAEAYQLDMPDSSVLRSSKADDPRDPKQRKHWNDV